MGNWQIGNNNLWSIAQEMNSALGGGGLDDERNNNNSGLLTEIFA